MSFARAVPPSSITRAAAFAVAVFAMTVGTLRFGSAPVLAAGSAHVSVATPTQSDILHAFGTAPLAFIPNVGQADARVSYLAEAAGASLYFTPTEATIALTRDDAGFALQLGFVGANVAPTIEGTHPAEATVNYFLGSDEAAWRTDVPTYDEVAYRAIWPGTDLVFRGAGGKLEYQFNLRPGANVQDIQLVYRGAQDLSLDEAGNLLIGTPFGQLMDSAPVAYQEIDGARVPVESSYAIHGDTIGFQVGAFDPAHELIIDPGLVYSTFLGGSSIDQAFGIAVDPSGNAYVTGFTSSSNFPTTFGSYDPTFNGAQDVFVTKFNPTGTARLYSTYIGGSSNDQGLAIAVDSGNAYVTGFTGSSDFPTASGLPPFVYRASYQGGATDAFVLKLGPAGGSLIFSTYAGGSGADQGLGINVHSSTDVYVTGVTASTNFGPTTNALQPTLRGPSDAFFLRLDRFAAAAGYMTYWGGTGDEAGRAIAIDENRNVYLTGDTTSTNFPTTAGAFDTTANGQQDAFVTKLQYNGSTSGPGDSYTNAYSTYLGGSGVDRGFGIARDAAGDAHVTGVTSSTFPTTPGAFQPTYRGGANDAFATKLNPTGSALLYSTYLGGSGDDRGAAVAIDSGGNASLTGRTSSSDFPATPGAFDTTWNGGDDAYVTKLSSAGSLLYSTFLGGSGGGVGNNDRGQGIAVDATATATAYVTGFANSSDFPTTPGAYDTTQNGDSDAFVTKLITIGAATTLVLSPATDTNVVGNPHTVTATVTDFGGQPVSGVTVRFSVTGANPTSGSNTTNASGQATFTYTGTHAGTDTISAYADSNNSGTQNAGEPSGIATKLWTAGPPASLTLAPKTATNPAGDQHCVTATVKDQYLNPTPGVTVNFSVSGANTAGGAMVTDANGQATFCYTGTHVGTDTIRAMAVGGSNPSDTATKTYTPAPPATVTLAPPTATNVVDAQHCVTATVKDRFGNPTPGITVRFSVSPTTFSTPPSGSVTTDANGQATFCYTSALPGSDLITAYADTNNNGVRDGVEPSGTATKTWILPPNNTACKVSDGGRITAMNGDKATFGGNATGAGPKGQQEYQDHGPAVDINVHSIDVLAVTCNTAGTMASIFGKATIDGAGSFDYRIDVQDLAEPGKTDTYRIRLSNGYDSGEQVLEGGKIQLH